MIYHIYHEYIGPYFTPSLLEIMIVGTMLGCPDILNPILAPPLGRLYMSHDFVDSLG